MSYSVRRLPDPCGHRLSDRRFRRWNRCRAASRRVGQSSLSNEKRFGSAMAGRRSTMQSLLRTLAFGVVLTLVVSVMSLSAQERDPRIGTWKLNVAQSTFDPGPPLQSETRTYEDRGGGVTLYTAEGINAQGNPTFIQAAYKLDGKDYPIATIEAQTVSDHRTISLKLVDADTV